MKRILAALLTITMLTITACSGNGGSAQPAQTAAPETTASAAEAAHSSETTAPAAEAADSSGNTAPAAETADSSLKADITYPVTLTDQLGREVTIEQEPETLVSGYYISTSLLIALGLKDKLVGIEAKAKSRNIYRLSAPEVIDLPSVGTAKEFDLEGCAALEPDLIILPTRLKDVIPSLEELGFTVLAVNPEDKELLEEAVTLLGTATNTADRAEELLAFHDRQLEPLTDALGRVSPTDAPTVYLAGNSSLLSVAGPAMYQNSLIEQAAGSNAAADITEDYWADVSYEQLLAWNPDYIILAADAEYTVDSVLQDENLAGCKAADNGHVYQFPNAIEAWDSPVPSSILGSMWLAGILHPETCPEDSWKQAAVSYYETFYGFTPDLDNLYAEAE